MKIKSALATQISGSIGGITGARNKGGMYLRSRAIPTDPSTANQQDQRNRVASAAAGWAALTQSQRDAWDTYASNVAVTDSLGDSILLSGQNWYLAQYTMLTQAGGTPASNGPTTMSLPTLGTVSMSNLDPGAQEIDISYDNSADWAIITGGYMLIQAGLPQSPGRSFYKSPFQFTVSVAGNTATPPTSPETVSYPFTFASGNKLFSRCRGVTPDGRCTAPMTVQGIA